MKQLARIFAAISLVFALSFGAVSVGTASAATCSTAGNPLSCACGAGGGAASGSSSCHTSGTDPISGPNGALKKISIILSFVAGVAAVVVILVAGLMFVTAGGDAQKIAGARKTIIGAVVGLVIIAASETLLIFVLNKL